MKIYGRVISIRKTKNYVFLIINSKDKKQIQIVIEKEKYENIEKNDIISVDAIIDINNNNGESYIAKKVSKVALGKKEESLKFNENALIIKSKITHNVRNFLSDERFIEIDLPILSFSENSSSSHSFKAKHDISDDTVYLRKNLDTMLRIITASNIDKIYSLGHCFRNEHITNKREPEFEMLSVYANYYSQLDMIEFTKKLICGIFSKEIKFQQIEYENYIKLKDTKLKDNFMYIVTHYPISKGSNAKIDCDENCMEEFRFISESGTVVHGITEINTQTEYEEMCERQNMRTFNGENSELHSSLKNGTAPCSSIGISLNRLIVDLCPEITDLRDLQVFPFSRVKRYKKNISLEKNDNYELLLQYFSEKDIRNLYFKEPYIFYVETVILKNVLQILENNSKYNIENIRTQIIKHPSKLRELINTYELISENIIQRESQGERDINE